MNQDLKKAYNRFSAFFRYLCAACPIAAAAFAFFYAAAMISDYDSSIGHISPSSVPFAAVCILSAFSVLLAAAGLFLSRRSASLVKDPADNPVTVFGAVLCAFMSAVSFVLYIIDFSNGLSAGFELAEAVLVPFVGISMALSIISSLRFSVMHRISAILALLCINLSMFADYFDFELPLNSPVRQLVTVAKAAALLYLVSEARFAFGAASGRLSLSPTVFASAAAASITLGFSLGGAILYFAAPSPANPNPHIFELSLCAAIGIHAVGRLFSLKEALGEYVPPKNESSENQESPSDK